MNIEKKEREAFEQWVSGCGLSISTKNALYRSYVMGWMWEAWQAVLQSPEIQALRKEVEGLYKGDPRNILADTGHTEADRIIRCLTSSDPDFADCTDAAILIRRLVLEEIKGPDGFATWKDAAVAERAARSAAKPNPEIVAMAREGISVYPGPNMNENKVFAELVRVSQAINAAMEKRT